MKFFCKAIQIENSEEVNFVAKTAKILEIVTLGSFIPIKFSIELEFLIYRP